MLRLYQDSRIINGIRCCYVAAKREEEMIIPDTLRKSVVFLGYEDSDGKKRFAGTGFFLALTNKEMPELGGVFRYTITAKHVIRKIDEKYNDGMARTNKVWARVNFKEGGSEWIETEMANWFTNPDDPSDVAVIDWTPGMGTEYEATHIKDDFVLGKNAEFYQKPGIGDEVAIIGLFVNHVGKKSNLPIVRIGNIAAMPEEKVATSLFGDIDAYLIESRSLGGLSGSPVFAHITTPRINEDGTLVEKFRQVRYFWLLGLVHGHYDAPVPIEDALAEDTTKGSGINIGIAIVIPVEKIMNTLNHEVLVNRRIAELEEARKDMLPVEDVAESDNDFTQDDFEQALKKASHPLEDQPDEGKSET